MPLPPKKPKGLESPYLHADRLGQATALPAPALHLEPFLCLCAEVGPDEAVVLGSSWWFLRIESWSPPSAPHILACTYPLPLPSLGA